jgi:hypothetical protein
MTGKLTYSILILSFTFKNPNPAPNRIHPAQMPWCGVHIIKIGAGLTNRVRSVIVSIIIFWELIKIESLEGAG